MLKKRVLKYLPRHRSSPILRRLNQICLRYHQAYENLDYDFYSNGEHFVLNTLRDLGQVKTVLDVGANIGDWAGMAARSLPAAHVFSFEIVPETFRKLQQNTSAYGNVSAFGLGLSDSEGQLPVYYDAERNANATCVEGITELWHRYRPEATMVDVTTGDRFCDEHGLRTIDFLKMDVEGLEPRVLDGFRNQLRKGNIKAIQFEYGYVNIVVKFLLKDFYDLLTPLGMRIGKIYPNRVEFKEYELQDENFYGPNYLAVHDSCHELIARLSAGTEP